MKNPKAQYIKRKKYFERLEQKQTRLINLISNLRLGVFLVGVFAIVLLFITENFILLAAVFLVSLFLFVYLIIKHEKFINNRKYSAFMVEINDTSIKRVQGEWNSFPDDGKEFMDENHHYSQDLDIFGDNSLFQWINTGKTYLGRQSLRDLLTQFPQNIEDIKNRQASIEELGNKLGWRQRLIAEGFMVSDKIKNPENLIQWAKEYNQFYCKHWLVAVLKILPLSTITLIITAVVTPVIPYYVPLIALFLQYILLKIRKKERSHAFGIADQYHNDLKVYYKMIKHLEKQHFKSVCLKGIQDDMCDQEGRKAFKQLDRLVRIIDSISNSRSVGYILFNILILWDYQSMIALEQWKQKSGQLLKGWFEAVGKVEALSSLSIIRYDNPGWVVPYIADDNSSQLEAKEMGHPLLFGNKVYNDLSINHNLKVLLITGSNMSGKSTLLRTIGINLVLAYVGAPVCAKNFSVSLMQVYTCMRIGDNLGKNISSFYAELLRIKTIVKEAKAGKKVFYLLDEIFKGTNSRDRHTGAKVLIQELIKSNSIGLVSTHDLELCDLEKKFPEIKNYHFQEDYKNDKIYFDYKLRQGASSTRNAIYLMKMAGIDIKEKDI